MVIDKEKLELIKQNLYEYTEEEVNELYTMAEYAVSLYIPRNHREFEDLTQYAITEFLNNSIKKFKVDMSSGFGSFAITCMINLILFELNRSEFLKYSLCFDNHSYNDQNINLDLYNITPSSFHIPSEKYESDQDEAFKKEVFEVVKDNAILNDYYFKNLTQEEIAKKYGYSQTYISRIIKTELNKIQKKFNIVKQNTHDVDDRRRVLELIFNVDSQLCEKIIEDPILFKFYIENLQLVEIAKEYNCSTSHIFRTIKAQLKTLLQLVEDSNIQDNGSLEELLWKLSVYKRFVNSKCKLSYRDYKLLKFKPILFDYFIEGLTLEQLAKKYNFNSNNQVIWNIKNEEINMKKALEVLRKSYIDEKIKENVEELNLKIIEAIDVYNLNYKDLQKLKEDAILNDYFYKNKTVVELSKEMGMTKYFVDSIIKKKMQKINEETEEHYNK